MTEEKIEFVDRDYGHCLRSEKPRLIKARMTSFNSIADKFRNFRLGYLQDKLEKMKNDALTTGYTNDNYSKKIEKKTKAIARLEEKIMLISKEDVPTDYVSKRAIKLKKSMIENLTYNSDAFYSVGLENKETVFANDLIPEIADADSAVAVDEDIPEEVGLPEIASDTYDSSAGVEVVVNDITRRSIADAVNTEFDNIDVVNAAQGDSNDQIEEYTNDVVGPQTISSEGALAEVSNADTVSDSSEISKEEVRNAIEAAFGAIEDSPVAVAEDNAFDEVAIREEVDDVIDKIRVSRNNANSAKMDKFDENGDVRPRGNRYHYTPMTDDEIRESQRVLGFDENGNIVDDGVMRTSLNVDVPKVTLNDVIVPKVESTSLVSNSAIRDLPVVVTDRDEVSSDYVFDMEGDGNMFDVIDVDTQNASHSDENADSNSTELVEYTFTDNASDVDHPLTGTQSNVVSPKLDDYLSLKDKILHLQEQKKITQQKKAEAVRTAEETAERAQQVKRMFEESQKTYEQSLSMLSAYTTALEEECAQNAKDAELAENDARMSNNFIALQQQKTDANNRVIEEIDGIINGDAVSSTRSR